MQLKKPTRSVFTEAPREAKFIKDSVVQLILPHYGLVESSSCLFDSRYPVFVKLQKMLLCAFEPCSHFKTDHCNLCAYTGPATNNFMNTGSDEYQFNKEQASKEFITKKKNVFSLGLLGFIIDHEGNSFIVSQPQDIDRLPQMDHRNTNRDAFRSVRAQLLFMSYSYRSEISYNVSQLCQVQHENVKSSDVRPLNHAVKYLQETQDLKL